MSDSLTLRFLGRLHECKRATYTELTGCASTFLSRGYYADVTETLPTRSVQGMTRAEIARKLREAGVCLIEQRSTRSGRYRALLYVSDHVAPLVTIAPRSGFLSAAEARDLAQRAQRVLGTGRKARLVWAAGALRVARVWSFRALTQHEGSVLRATLRQAERRERGRKSLDPTPWLPLDRPATPPPAGHPAFAPVPPVMVEPAPLRLAA